MKKPVLCRALLLSQKCQHLAGLLELAKQNILIGTWKSLVSIITEKVQRALNVYFFFRMSWKCLADNYNLLFYNNYSRLLSLPLKALGLGTVKLSLLILVDVSALKCFKCVFE